ncbi:hypothetical protein DFJ73DRAFT_956192 [Zopfochytrium polystomum]|nr:hypothetical protein DFJ73DRAFT_956192 [Zopfochytrium polystomum]
MSYYNRGGGGGGGYDNGGGRSNGGSRYQQDDRGGYGGSGGSGGSRYQQDDRGGYGGGGGGGYDNGGSRYNQGGGGYDNGGSRYDRGGGGGSRYQQGGSGYDRQGGGGGYGNTSGYGNPPPQERRWEDVDDEEENYNDEGWLERKTKKTQQDSVDTTRRALAKLREAEDSATAGLTRLNQQSEQLHNIEHRLKVADSQAKVAEAKTGELKALNRFFMIPTFGAGKKAARIEQQAKREMAEKEEREQERKTRVQETLGNNGRYGGGGGGGGYNGGGGGRYGKSYTTPDGLERDEREVEIDNNLDQMSAGLAQLKMMGMAMDSEIKKQNEHIGVISATSEDVRPRIEKTNRVLNTVLKK